MNTYYLAHTILIDGAAIGLAVIAVVILYQINTLFDPKDIKFPEPKDAEFPTTEDINNDPWLRNNTYNNSMRFKGYQAAYNRDYLQQAHEEAHKSIQEATNKLKNKNPVKKHTKRKKHVAKTKTVHK